VGASSTLNTARGPLSIVVMGVSGSGKSVLGRQLAASLNTPFIEGDDFHPPGNVAKMRAGIALEDKDRWPWLDAVGSALGIAAREHGLVVGACSALKHSHRDRLRLTAGVPLLFVCLQADASVIADRMEGRREHFMPASLLASQIAILEPPDATEDALLVNSTKPLDRIVPVVRAEVLSRLAALTNQHRATQ
jgi:gluconokinase